MPSIYSDEMRENILADFSSKNPKVSASIIERFGENPRSKGIGALEAEQYRAMVDAPLQSSPVMAWGGWRAKRRAGEKPFRDWFKKRSSVDADLVDTEEYDVSRDYEDWLDQDVDVDVDLDLDTDTDTDTAPEIATSETNPWAKGASDIADAVFALINLSQAGKDIETPTKAPRWRAPKTSEIKGVGGIGMNDGGTVLNRRLFLGGGEVDGIGGERDDLVPIWASDREYVVSANGVRRMGGGNHARGIAALDEINNNGRLV